MSLCMAGNQHPQVLDLLIRLMAEQPLEEVHLKTASLVGLRPAPRLVQEVEAPDRVVRVLKSILAPA